MCGLHRYNDPPYVKMKKVELLTELCNAGNAESIVSELGWVYNTSSQIQIKLYV